MPDKQDSNITSCFIAHEATPKVLPGAPDWREQEPNSYADFGGNVSTVARETINAGRQDQFGSATGVEASGGFTQDFTMTNHLFHMRRFFFAEYTHKYDNQRIGVAAVQVTAVTGANAFTVANVLVAADVGLLLIATGFDDAANNALHKVSAVAAGSITTTSVLTNNAAAQVNGRLQSVGFEFAAGDVALALIAGGFTLTSAAVDIVTRLNLRLGEWLYIGGDAAGNKFAQTGFARLSAVSANGKVLTFDKSTAAFAATAGAGISLRLFAGKFIRNESDPTLQLEHTCQIERQMGRDDDGIMSEVLVGCYANEFTLNIPSKDKLTADVAYVALDNEPRTGLDGLKAGARTSALKESAVNTSRDVVRIRCAPVDPTTLNPTPHFGYVSEGNLKISNGVTPNNAVGVFGAFSVSKANFKATGSLTAFFSTMVAVKAIRANGSVTVDLIAARANKGFIFDIPLLMLGGGRANVEKDKPIMLPAEIMGAENPFGFTLSATFFPYLPTVAMPV